MTDQQHPISPPPELVQQWVDTYFGGRISQSNFHLDIATRAAQWGADQQLAKDAEWLDQHALDAPHLKITPVGASLKEAMRPKPQSLKEQAIQALELFTSFIESADKREEADIIRRALEQIDD